VLKIFPQNFTLLCLSGFLKISGFTKKFFVLNGNKENFLTYQNINELCRSLLKKVSFVSFKHLRFPSILDIKTST
jgi:hypothetical protein